MSSLIHPDGTQYSIAELENLVANHRKRGITDSPQFAAALRELEMRRRGFDFHKSMKLILDAARRDEFVCCKDLADANGLEWSYAYRKIGAHLGAIAEYSTAKYGLLFDTLVVNKQHKATGKYEPGMLKGFIGWATTLGYTIGDDDGAFLREQQARVFAWAKENVIE